MGPMTRWDDRRAYLRRRAISALYPLSRLWPGSYEQPELWVSDALRTCYVVNPKVACSSIQVALTEAATGEEVQGFRHNHPAVLAFDFRVSGADAVDFSVYDPNDPTVPGVIRFDRRERRYRPAPLCGVDVPYLRAFRMYCSPLL